MNIRAKVNSADVLSLKTAAENMNILSDKFSSAVSHLESLIAEARFDIDKLEEAISSVATALTKIEEKESRIEDAIAKLNNKISEIEERISKVESKLSVTPEYIEKTIRHPGNPQTGEGPSVEIIEVKNSRYSALEDKKNLLENRKSELEAQKEREEIRLERVRLVKSKINDAKSEIVAAKNEFEDCCNQCRRYIDELQDISASNQNNGQEAVDKLSVIIKIIKKYRNQNIDYSNIELTKNMNEETISEFAPQYIKSSENDETPKLTKKEIKEHGIKLNEFDRVTEYDGKVFGGMFKTYIERLNAVPKKPFLGAFEGTLGESTFIPSDQTAMGIEALRELAKFGINGIVYRNAEPDFEVCSYAVVKIDNMSSNRDGNFTSADTACAAMWNKQMREGRTDWLPRDVQNYRKANRLSWHEKCDTVTMVLVKTVINEFFDHSGGVAECKARDGIKNAGDGTDE